MLTHDANIGLGVRTYVIESFLTEQQASDFSDRDDLFAVLDSLQILRLVIHLETAFEIKITDEDLSAAKLGSVERIAAFVATKLRKSAPCDGPVVSCE